MEFCFAHYFLPVFLCLYGLFNAQFTYWRRPLSDGQQPTSERMATTKIKLTNSNLLVITHLHPSSDRFVSDANVLIGLIGGAKPSRRTYHNSEEY